jgi:hypothetical protein
MLLQLKPLDPHQSVRELDIALKLVRMGYDHQPVVKIDDATLLHQLARRVLVDRLALGKRALCTGLIQQSVHIRIAETTVIVGLGSLCKAVDIAIRVRSSGPGQNESLVAACFRLDQRGGKLGDTQLHLEPGFCSHGLNDLGNLLGFRAIRDHEVDNDRRL